MKLFAALCLLGVVATSLARPNNHHPGGRPPMHNGDRPSHPIAHPEITPELQEFLSHMHDFVKLYPRREIRQIIRSHMKNSEMRATMKFLRSPQLTQILHTIFETPEVEAIAQYIGEASWPWIQTVVEQTVVELEIEGMMAVPDNISKRSTGGLSELLDDLIAVLPKEELRALYNEKMDNSPVFRSVMEIVTSEELKTLLETASASAVIQEQFATLLENGVDVNKVYDSYLALFGF